MGRIIEVLAEGIPSEACIFGVSGQKNGAALGTEFKHAFWALR